MYVFFFIENLKTHGTSINFYPQSRENENDRKMNTLCGPLLVSSFKQEVSKVPTFKTLPAATSPARCHKMQCGKRSGMGNREFTLAHHHHPIETAIRYDIINRTGRGFPAFILVLHTCAISDRLVRLRSGESLFRAAKNFPTEVASPVFSVPSSDRGFVNS